jgi:hypothetical protein
MMIRVAAAEDSQDPPTRSPIESAAAAAAATSQVVSEPGPNPELGNFKLINYREQVSVLPGPGPGPSPRLVQRTQS